MGRSTTVSRRIGAARARVYAALIDPEAVVAWKVPAGMSSAVHTFEPRVGGAIRISLTYDAPVEAGKTTPHTDTYRGRFVELVPNERIVEIDEFETSDPALQGEMRITVTLADVDGGTLVTGVHDGLPPGISIADNEMGWRSSLARLAALVEEGGPLDPAPRGLPEMHAGKRLLLDATEPRALGLPLSWFRTAEPIDLRWARHPYRWVRWRLEVRRRGPYAPRFEDFRRR